MSGYRMKPWLVVSGRNVSGLNTEGLKEAAKLSESFKLSGCGRIFSTTATGAGCGVGKAGDFLAFGSAKGKIAGFFTISLFGKYFTVKAYQPINYATVMWRYHVTRMEIFCDPQAVGLQALLNKLKSQEVPAVLDFQAEVQTELKKACGLGPALDERKRSANSEEGDKPAKQQKKQKQGQEYMYAWGDEIAKARKLVAPVSLTMDMLCPDPAATEAMLGPELTSIFGGRPCKHLLFNSRCRFGKGCSFVHSPTGTPSEGAVEGVKSRISARAKVLEAKAKN